MRVGAAALAGGTLGVLGTLCLIVAFATDYWLLVKENCWYHPAQTTMTLSKDTNSTEVQSGEAATANGMFTLHHEGFFRYCVLRGDSETQVFQAFYTYQKLCTRGYLFPLPVAHENVPDPAFDATAVFRGFWTVFIILGLFAALVGSFLLVCGVPFISHKLYKVGGAFLIAAGCLFLSTLLFYALWVELVDVRSYILQERRAWCPDAYVDVYYGQSFMVAAAGVPLEISSGLVFMLVGRALRSRQ
ncbi:transmembrane protein 182 [Nothobranchius furzeri]|uniref:Transcript variant X1 n=3 Tax=Nothobranchius furzeri TaxID=105023 RepID=A0A8C6KG25_NOTFU|nr:transmembrane protein 182 [Nothobranchius furzeri]XP_054594342.1 transmembrane protein 182 [Nothobranchius furzeri]KAF7227743.1 transcript variant X2 [Nothobranchius furzeri]KAF7227744.1 transcript variant X1 [Nothobranchius furzeri]